MASQVLGEVKQANDRVDIMIVDILKRTEFSVAMPSPAYTL